MRGLHPEIKWPNDVLLNRRKVCGILAEAVWMGEKVDCIVLGIGVNVKPEAVPPSDQLNFPATSIEAEMGKSVDRLILLRDILQALLYWRGLLTKDVFSQCLGKTSGFPWGAGGNSNGGSTLRESGRLKGWSGMGVCGCSSQDGQVFMVQFGEVHLRPVL